ncbi:SAM-dependent methyltransferase, partial [Planobispora longispora]
IHAGYLSTEDQARATGAYRSTNAGSITTRTPAHLDVYTQGLEVLDPGIVPVQSWRPEFEEDAVPDFTKPGIIGVVAKAP